MDEVLAFSLVNLPVDVLIVASSVKMPLSWMFVAARYLTMSDCYSSTTTRPTTRHIAPQYSTLLAFLLLLTSIHIHAFSNPDWSPSDKSPVR